MYGRTHLLNYVIIMQNGFGTFLVSHAKDSELGLTYVLYCVMLMSDELVVAESQIKTGQIFFFNIHMFQKGLNTHLYINSYI